MIGWDTGVFEPPIRESATGDMLCLSRTVTSEMRLFLENGGCFKSGDPLTSFPHNFTEIKYKCELKFITLFS